ncbi:MAG: type II toxin-antitoxin system RelE/ParE family toxin [Acetobacter sp.]|nr:type II toxin-antitoxin system RelE/ParE family toxin [Acetobacter sp.]MBO6086262.1 type II toxin-antitoxin system RelE/ParE family toxin [Acetobacter sp.]
MPLYHSKRTETFKKWIAKLRDQRARARISEYLERLLEGNFSNVKPLGGGISELRIDYGPGYRVYYTEKNGMIILLLAGGDKSTQDKDIAKARKLAQEWKE